MTRYAGETHRIVADRHGRSIVLGWTNGMALAEIRMFTAYFGSVSIEKVDDPEDEESA